ncbi:MAG: large conductance mechanosensitive channel protein MscL [Burkholderiaceae bacterium]|nr:large conductance mechanosensitive channel protein MscL [Burkholderiaceae bacterium]
MAKQFIKDFQAFISRGNVIDMAVGVIVGAAFSAIVNSMVKDIVNPILGFLVGSQDFSHLFWVLSMPENYTGPMTYVDLTKAGATVLGYGSFLTATFHFLLLAFVVFCMVRVITKVRKHAEDLLKKEKEEAVAKEAAKPAAPPPTPEDIQLLREIRDLLKNKS